jgi:hypothetical protein
MASVTTDRIDGLSTELAIKAPVKAATTGNITLSAVQTIDGISCSAGDRVLVKDQTTGTEDGIYLVQSTSWTRAKDWDGPRDITRGTLVIVTQGTVNSDTVWRTTATDDPYVIGTVDPTLVLAEFFGNLSGGFKYKFDSSTTTAEDPGDGDFRLNNSAIAAATVITLSNNSADFGNADVSDVIATWDDSTQSSLRGTITITELGAPANFATFNINAAITDSTTHLDVPVAYVAGSGTFTSGNNYTISFARTGNANNAGFQWDFDSSTSMGDPGTGDVRFDNATVGSVANLAFSKAASSSGNPDVSAWIATWDDSTNTDIRGTITIINGTSLGEFATFSVTGAVTDNTDWLQVAVAHVASSGTPTSGDVLFIHFTRTGDIGEGAGVRMRFDEDTADADQGVGKIWANHETIGSATVIFLDDVEDAAGASINSWVDSFDDSTATIQGTLTLTKQIDPAVFAIFNVTGAVTSASTYSKIACTFVTGAGAFSAGDKVTVNFARAGDDGADGAGSGDMLRANNLSDVGAAATAFGNIKQAASLTATGVAETATQTEVNTGTDSLRYIAPSTLANSNFVNAHNYLLNGNFTVAQRGVSFTSATTPANSDDTYLLDQWILLSDGNDIVDVTQGTDAAVGNGIYLQADIETVEKKFGFLQVIPNKDSQNLLSESDVVSLSFNALVSNAAKLSRIKAMVLSWTSTADAVTSDIVSAWQGEGTSPTVVSNWTIEGDSGDLGVTASDVRYKLENVAINASGVNNIAVFIWSDDVGTNDTAGSLFKLTNVQLEVGPKATAFAPRPFQQEFDLCQYWMERIYSSTTSNQWLATGYADNTSSGFFRILFHIPKKAIPTITYSAAADFRVWYTGGSFQETTATAVPGNPYHSIYHASLDFTTASASLTAGDAIALSNDGTADRWIEASSEL